MKKKIAILGSTGSIGLSSLKIIDLKREYFKVELLAASKNYKCRSCNAHLSEWNIQCQGCSK